MQAEPEAAPELDDDPAPEEWPQKGGVSVRGLVMRYRPSLPTVLKNVNFEVCFRRASLTGLGAQLAQAAVMLRCTKCCVLLNL